MANPETLPHLVARRRKVGAQDELALKAAASKHLQAYLDEYAFRHNRRKTNGVGRIAARVIEQLVARPP